ncbi:hypothetical protein H310_05661 [Aphanomyces invadans]|uniref:Uncharacterized protein n=1 Tax=Aphanomyces invadans TaxID=157072 RepID=A0A024U6Z7_9STRA|nr:hypothetical protein H310_05661 [Aphanomyces invadans]ETW02044.1 hypothetical protein H310_05661 [Aphanomyces invadans]|eukprot:XP_008868649.1 hypothetical protein H310_05661 [Aphanomyces invadans]
MKPALGVLALTMATVVAGGGIYGTRGDVKFVDTLSAIHSYEEQNPSVASVHDEVRRALLDGAASSEQLEEDFANAQEKYMQLKKLRVQVEMATSHCQDDNCFDEEQRKLFAYLQRAGKFKGNLPPIGTFSRERASFPLPEFPSADEHELETPVERPAPRYMDHMGQFDLDDDDEENMDLELDDGDFVDEFAYDRKKNGRRGYFPSKEEMEDQIRRQVEAHLMDARDDMQGKVQWTPEGAATASIVCLPYTSICDFNIVAGIIYTALVSLLVSVFNQSKGSRKKSKKK